MPRIQFGRIFYHAVKHHVRTQFLAQFVVGHGPRGLPDVGESHEVHQARGHLRLHVNANALHVPKVRWDAQTQWHRPADAPGARFREAAHLAHPVRHHVDLLLSGHRFATERLAQPIQFQAVEIVILHPLPNVREHEIPHFAMFVIQPHPRTCGESLGSHCGPERRNFGYFEQRAIEMAAGRIGHAVHIVHPTSHPGTDAAGPASLGRFCQPINTLHSSVQLVIKNYPDGRGALPSCPA